MAGREQLRPLHPVQVEDDQPHGLDQLLLEAGLELGRSPRAIRSVARRTSSTAPWPEPRAEWRGGHKRLIAALAARDVDAARAVMHNDVAATEAAIPGLSARRAVTSDA